MLYVLGANTLGHYDYPNHEITFGLEAARSFIALGVPATVLWGGSRKIVDGIPHAPAWGVDAAAPGPDDTLLVMHSLLGAAVATESIHAHLRGAGRRWLWASCCHLEPDGRLVHRDAWAWYQQIWIECPGGVRIVANEIPSSRVNWCIMGVPHIEPSSLTNPFPDNGRRHLFFAGRIHDAGWFRRLVSSLSDNYEVWCAAPSIRVRSDDVAAGSYAGQSLLVEIPGITPTPRDENGLAIVSASKAHETMSAIVPDRRFHWLGTMPFGSFWGHHHFAFASLDHGFEAPVLPINSKIFDPLAVGGRVAADGHSPSFYLLDHYEAGGVVAHDNTRALAAMVDEWAPEEQATRLERLARVLDGESWLVRVRKMMVDIST